MTQDARMFWHWRRYASMHTGDYQRWLMLVTHNPINSTVSVSLSNPGAYTFVS